MAAVVGLRQHQLRMNQNNQANADELANFSSSLQNNSNKGGSADSIPLPKLGSPATSSQLNNNNDIGFPIPRLASPAIPNLHALNAFPNLQFFGGGGAAAAVANELLANSKRNETETKSHSENTKRATSLRDLSNGRNKNGENFEQSQRSPADSIQDLSVNSPQEKQTRILSDDLDDLNINGLPFKPSLTEFLASSPTANQQIFSDDLSDFDRVTIDSPDRLTKETNEKIKAEPFSDCRDE